MMNVIIGTHLQCFCMTLLTLTKNVRKHFSFIVSRSCMWPGHYLMWSWKGGVISAGLNQFSGEQETIDLAFGNIYVTSVARYGYIVVFRQVQLPWWWQLNKRLSAIFSDRLSPFSVHSVIMHTLGSSFNSTDWSNTTLSANAMFLLQGDSVKISLIPVKMDIRFLSNLESSCMMLLPGILTSADMSA